MTELSLTIERLPVYYLQSGNRFFPAWSYVLPTTLLRLPFSILLVRGRLAVQGCCRASMTTRRVPGAAPGEAVAHAMTKRYVMPVSGGLVVGHCVLVYRFDARGGQVQSHLQLCLGCPDLSLRDRQCC